MSIIPGAADRIPSPRTRGGIVVGLHPSSDPSFEIELQRSVGSSASTDFSTLTYLRPADGQLTYSDQQQTDGVTRFYRARSVKAGYDPSAFTAIVGAKPVDLFARDQPPYVPITGRDLDVDIRIRSSNTIKVGSLAGSSYVTKTLVVPFSATVPGSTGSKQVYSAGGYVGPSVVGQLARVFGGIELPPGVVMTQFQARLKRSTAADDAEVLVRRVTSTGGVSLLAQLDATHTTGWASVTSSAMTETYSTSNSYFFSCDLRANSSISQVGFHSLRVTYRMANYSQGL